MHYLIDGYNLLFRSLRASEGDFKRVRENFIHHLAEQIKMANLSATLIFDAPHTESFGERGAVETLPIHYTDHKQTADEYLVEFVGKAKYPKEITVVTSDSRLAWLIRGKGGYSMSVEEFRVMLGKKGVKEERKRKDEGLRIKDEGQRTKEEEQKAKLLIKKPVVKRVTEMERWEEAFQKEEGGQEVGIKESGNQRIKGIQKREEGLMTDMQRWQKAFEEKKEKDEFGA